LFLEISGFRYPIALDAASRAARTSQAKYVASQRALETDAIRDQVQAAAASAWAQLQAAVGRSKNARIQLQAANTALVGIREQWNMGDRTMREVLDAEQEFLAAEINLIIAERDRIVASYAIARVTGKLTLASLNRFTLTAANDHTFDLRSTVIRHRPAQKRNAQSCGNNCSTFTENWRLRVSVH